MIDAEDEHAFNVITARCGDEIASRIVPINVFRDVMVVVAGLEERIAATEATLAVMVESQVMAMTAARAAADAALRAADVDGHA
jgi:hypothetical protein